MNKGKQRDSGRSRVVGKRRKAFAAGFSAQVTDMGEIYGIDVISYMHMGKTYDGYRLFVGGHNKIQAGMRIAVFKFSPKSGKLTPLYCIREGSAVAPPMKGALPEENREK